MGTPCQAKRLGDTIGQKLWHGGNHVRVTQDMADRHDTRNA
jgi:hypothetical protein